MSSGGRNLRNRNLQNDGSISGSGGSNGIIDGSSINLGDDQLIIETSNSVVTSDEAGQTQTLLSTTLALDSITLWEAHIIAIEDVALPCCRGYKFFVLAVNNNNTLTITSKLEVLDIQSGLDTSNITADTSGGSVRIRVEGIATRTIKWVGSVIKTTTTFT
jgi:hypothetical protein